jgi:hypothetical protein
MEEDMINRLAGLTGAMLVATALSSLPLLAANAQDAQAQEEMKPMTGIWALNEEASENPSGEARPSLCEGGRRGGGGDQSRVNAGAGGLGGGGDSSGGTVMYGGGAGNATLGAEETQRFCSTLVHFYDAPPMMGMRVTETAMLQLLDPETNFGYQHEINDKNQEAMTPGGPAEFKVKWDDDKLVREITTQDSLKIVEEYSLTAEGQLIVEFKEAGSRMVRVPDPKIRRVYDHQQ